MGKLGGYKLEGFTHISEAEADAMQGNLPHGEALVRQKRRGIAKLSGSAHARSCHSTEASEATARGLVECIANRHAADLRKHKTTRADGTVKRHKTRVKARERGFTVVATRTETKRDGLLLRGHSAKAEKREKKLLQAAAKVDRARSLADDATPRFAEADGRMLRVSNYEITLASRSPWVVHFPKPKKGAALPSRVFSPTKVAKDADERVWVAGDVVPRIKKAELVGAAISVDDTSQCHHVAPLKVVKKKPKA